MDAVALLLEYARRHDEAVAGGDPAGIALLFAEDGEIAFHGVAVPTARGRAAVERLFRERGPDDLLVLGEVVPGPPGSAHAVYGWRRRPGLVGGTVRVRVRDGAIGRLDVLAIPGGPRAPEPREAARALVVTAEPRVLLLPCTEPGTEVSWWITPGGGIEPGESPLDAVRRELAEETGIESGPAARPLVWVRRHLFTWGRNAVLQREFFFWVRLEDVVRGPPRATAAELAAEGLRHPARWWTLDELRSTTSDVFAPRNFPALLESLLRDGPPDEPLDVGV